MIIFPLNEKESRVDLSVEEDGSHHAREMEEECDQIANLLISQWCLIMTLICKNIIFPHFFLWKHLSSYLLLIRKCFFLKKLIGNHILFYFENYILLNVLFLLI